MSDYIDFVNKRFLKYNFTEEEKKRFISYIEPIVKHDEFQKRLDSKVFCHHGSTSLGEHIISDAIETFHLVKKKDSKNINERLAVIIAMFHDLYELPWQNQYRKQERFVNKHGFVHPIEAIINACTWYPEYFKDEQDANIIIDGVIHHMFPFPVRVFDNTNLDLNNLEKFFKLNDNIRNLIELSTARNKVFRVSFSRSKSIEGRLVAKADKCVTVMGDHLSIRGYIALITGRNKDLDKK